MTFPYLLVKDSERGVTSLTIHNGSETLVVDSSSKAFDAVFALVKTENDWEALKASLSSESRVRLALEPLSERVSVANGNVYFDGDAVHGSIANLILRYLDEDNDQWVGIVNFLENLNQNPSAHSREQLWAWLEKRDFTITEDGHFIGYKGVNPDLTSINSGYGFVDGERVEHITNNVGSVITFPRSEVDDDPNSACSTGLHVGEFSYAKSFGRGSLLVVKVNPRDVVSVPHDSDSQKIRTCRYEVLSLWENDSPYESVVYDESDEDEDNYCEDDICEDCGVCTVCYGCECDDEEVDFEYDRNQVDLVPTKRSTGRPTDTNYLKQPRDAFGRFLPKS